MEIREYRFPATIVQRRTTADNFVRFCQQLVRIIIDRITIGL